jgi:RND superfamily putative drug exporter
MGTLTAPTRDTAGAAAGARWAGLAVRRPRVILVVAAILFALAGTFGVSVAKHLSSGGFADNSTPSARATQILAHRFHAGDPNLVLLVETPGVNSPAAVRVGTRIADQLAKQPHVANVESYWTVPPTAARGLVSRNGRDALVIARVLGNDNQAPTRAAAVADRFVGVHDGIRVLAGGLGVAYQEVSKQISHDLALAEAIAVPITFLVLVWVFGSLIAALLPVAIGVLAIVGTLAVLRLLTLATPVSVYSLNLTTAMGLGLAIDYSLFIVSRYREELRAGRGRSDAVVRTMRSAGRTVLFSALTVGLSMAALLVFPLYFLRSFAYAGLAVVAIASAGAGLVLPALLLVLGDRVEKFDLRKALGRPAGNEEDGFWGRMATLVMRRPVPLGLAVTALLVALGLPFLGVRFGLPDDRVLPTSASAHQVGAVIRSQFAQDGDAPLTVVIPHGSTRAGLVGYATRLSTLPGVTTVTSSVGTFVSGQRVAGGPASMTRGDSSYLVLSTPVDPYSRAGSRLVNAVRGEKSPWHPLVTGEAAASVDTLHSLGGELPLAIALVVLATFGILFAFTRSALLPLKALVLNTLSLSATFGAMVFVFQEGHLQALFGNVQPTGYLTATMPILMFCVAFGLSMDYEVFLVSRIREEWLGTRDNIRSVARGLARTGRIVTAAALLISIVFVSVATSQVTFIRLFGTGMALAVLMDATLVRGVLVPAFMRLAGRANWWPGR